MTGRKGQFQAGFSFQLAPSPGFVSILQRGRQRQHPQLRVMLGTQPGTAMSLQSKSSQSPFMLDTGGGWGLCLCWSLLQPAPGNLGVGHRHPITTIRVWAGWQSSWGGCGGWVGAGCRMSLGLREGE